MPGDPESFGRANPSAAELAVDALHKGQLSLPLPDASDDGERLARLAAWGRINPGFARLAEGHTEAMAILSEFGGPPAGDQMWAVWSEHPQSVTAALHRGGWMLSGLRPGCFGTDVCRRALLTARTDAGIRLFAVDVADVDVVSDAAPTTDGTQTITLTAVPGIQVGDVDAYGRRPGRWHHRLWLAACWFGGAQGVADMLDRRRPARVGAFDEIDESLLTAGCLIAEAAVKIDKLAWTDQWTLTDHVYRGVVAAAAVVIEQVSTALDVAVRPEAARRIADLSAFLRDGCSEFNIAAGQQLRQRQVAVS